MGKGSEGGRRVAAEVETPDEVSTLERAQSWLRTRRRFHHGHALCNCHCWLESLSRC